MRNTRIIIVWCSCLLLLPLVLKAQTDSTKVAPATYQVTTPDSNVINIIINNNQPAAITNNGNGDFSLLPDGPPTTPKEEVKAFNPWELFSWGKIITALLFGVFSYFTIGICTRLMYYMSERSTNYRITIKGLVPIFRILSWTMVLYIMVAGIFKPPFQAIVALATSFGIAIGFASQDILKNIFGGLMILLDRPFIVGDKIEVGSYYGEVVEIGLRSTRIVTPDDSLVSIPNSEMMNSSLSNSNVGETNCQVVAEIYLPITVNTQRVREIALEAAQVSSYIYLNKPITVLFFNEVKERRSYLKMRLKAYVMDIRHEFVFKSDLTEIVIRELLEAEIIKADEVF